MHVSDRKGAVSIESVEGELQFDGGVGVSGEMLEFFSMSYESARELHSQLTRLLDSRDVIVAKGLEIMTRAKA